MSAEMMKKPYNTMPETLAKARKAFGRPLTLAEKIVSVKVISLHTDISTKTGERVIIFILTDNLEVTFEFR